VSTGSPEFRQVVATRPSRRASRGGRELGIGLTTSTDEKRVHLFPRVAFGGVRVTVEAKFDYAAARREDSAREDPLVVDLRLGGPRD
jgi:hypothetical protein